MIKPRHRRGRSLATSLLLASLRGALVSGAVAVVAVATASGTPTAVPAPTTLTPAGPGLAHAVADHGCSATGFAPGTIPSSALIQTDRGRVRRVSFEVGWDVYTGRRPGTLIAVCQR